MASQDLMTTSQGHEMNDFDNSSDFNESDPISPNLIEAYYDAIAFENAVGIVIPTLFAFVIFVGVLGNSLVITVVAVNRQMRNSTNVLIINLALADLLFLVFCVPFTATDYALPIWVFSPSWCACLYYLQFVTAYASVWTLVLMAFDRFLAVVFPVQSITLRTVRNTVVCIVGLWVVILTANISQLEVYGIFEYTFVFEARQTCTFIALAKGTATAGHVHAHYAIFTSLGYFAPLIITCFFYFFVLRKLWFKMPLTRSRMSEESHRAKRKVTWMVTGVIVTFAICWLPLNICFMYTAVMYRQNHAPPGTKEFAIIMMTSQVLAYANSCANPILYAFLSDNFRKGFYRIWYCIVCDSKKVLYRRNASYERSELRCTPTFTEQTSAAVCRPPNRQSSLTKTFKNGETVSLRNGNVSPSNDDEEL